MRKNILFFVAFLLIGAGSVFVFKFVSQQYQVEQLKSPLPLTQFSLDTAPSSSLRGKLSAFSGDVGWESRSATEPAKVTNPLTLQQGEQITTKENGRATIDFPNLFSAFVYPKTKLEILQTLPTHMVFRQELGTVEYTKAPNNVVSIRSHGLLINLQNGSALVSVSQTQPLITITVEKGNVTLAYNDTQLISQLQSFTAGNKLLFYTDTREIITKPVSL